LPLSRADKQKVLDDYREKLRGSQAALLVDYRGLKVSSITRLRRQLRETGCTFTVIKNTLLAQALQAEGMPVPEALLKGPVAVGFCTKDPSAAAKVLNDFVKETKIIAIRGGIISNKVLDSENIVALATLPPREVLLAQLLGSLQGPAGALVGLLTAPLRQLVYVLQSHGEQAPQSA